MSETDSFLASARAYAESFDQGDLTAPPTRKVAILTCMDARLDLYGMLGLSTGDAHILRNAGGVVTDDAIRSLALSQHLLGTEEIVLVHHTGCGLLAITDAEFDDLLEAEAGKRPQWRAHAFADIEQDVRDGIARLRSSPFIPHKKSIRGFVYEVETGFLREVE